MEVAESDPLDVDSLLWLGSGLVDSLLAKVAVDALEDVAGGDEKLAVILCNLLDAPQPWDVARGDGINGTAERDPLVVARVVLDVTDLLGAVAPLGLGLVTLSLTVWTFRHLLGGYVLVDALLDVDGVVLVVADPPGVGAPLGLGSGLACRCQIF